jgi:triacylglycerol lipase
MNITGFVMSNIAQANDGLVCEDSFPWGERYTLVNPDSPIGISHSDVTDLFRTNHPDFDVREFYVNLVNDLKVKGL